MKFSELKGRAVVNLEDARKIGEVEDLMVDPNSHHIVSLKARTGLFHAAKMVPVTDVKNVGADAVTISEGAGLANAPVDGTNAIASGNVPTSPMDGQIKSADSTESPQALIEISSLMGNKVVTDAGTMVGELSDVMVDWVDLTITGYEVHERGLFAKAQEFAATPEVRYGDKMITIPAQLLNRPN